MNSASDKPVSDSPWFWLLLFGAMALAMAAVIEPKFSKRHERLERMHQARSRAAARSAAGEEWPGGQSSMDDADDANLPAETAEPSGGGSLRPLMFVIAGLMVLALIGMVIGNARRRKRLIDG
jgi:hypothetical protein